MKERYYIMYDPKVFNLMDLINKNHHSPADIISYLTNQNAEKLNEENYLDYLHFDFNKQRRNAIEQMGTENYSMTYIANQLTHADNNIKVILSDGKRRKIDYIISEESGKPEAVFITSISPNFPTAAATAIILNHAKIPVILGGIHVSSSPNDVDIYIRNHAPHPELISFVIGPGDLNTIKQIVSDLKNHSLEKVYRGSISIEDGVWGNVSCFNQMGIFAG